MQHLYPDSRMQPAPVTVGVPSARGRIISLQQASTIAAMLRRQGLRVGFTNGCFDMLHPGHLHSLQAAKHICDILFVGLNSDTSVRELKGEGRPKQSENVRAEILAALRCVDYVIIFRETTATNLVKKIKPDVIAKEGYPLEQWPEARVVQEQGGVVVQLSRLHGYSTTESIRKMAQDKESFVSTA